MLGIDDLFDQLKGATIFSKIYLRSGHHHVDFKQEDIYTTSFRTRYEDYDFVVFPLSLTNARANFMCLMNNVLHPYLEIVLTVFIDDIFIYYMNEEEHVKPLATVLTLLREH